MLKKRQIHTVTEFFPIFIEVLALFFVGWSLFWTFIWEAVWWHKGFGTILTTGIENGNLIVFAVSSVLVFGFRYLNLKQRIDKGVNAFNQLNSKKSRILLVVSILVSILAVLSVFYSTQAPAYQTQTTTICKLEHSGDYDYTAYLKPNLIYNKTVLKPEDEIIYTETVEHIDFTFTYSFKADPQPQEVVTQNDVTIQMESPEKWSKTLSDFEEKQILALDGDIDFTLHMNVKAIKDIISAIDKETGTISTTYNTHIQPAIHTTVDTNTGEIDDFFYPDLTVEFVADQRGEYIRIENLHLTKTETLTDEQKIPLTWVIVQRNGSYFALAASVTLLGASVFHYVQLRHNIPFIQKMEKLASSYKDIIVKITKPAPYKSNVIKMDNMQDLVKTAEILGRPIFYSVHEKSHVFYILEDDTKYEYHVEN